MSVEPTPAIAEIENLLAEQRTFPPDPAFAAQANAKADLYVEAETDFEAFWARLARERIDWFEPFDTTLEWDLPFAKWFVGGKLNIAYNCLDRHVERGLGDKVAYHWIGEPGDTRTHHLRRPPQREVSKAANALKELGVGDRRPGRDLHADDPGAADRDARLRPDRCPAHGRLRRLLAPRRSRGRINDAEAKLVITADGGWRRGKPAALKPAVDEALAPTPDHRARRSSSGASATRSRAGPRCRTAATSGGTTSSIASPSEHPPVPLDSEHMLYLLYTSGTTAKPKGIIHTTAGYLLGASFTHEMVFDIKPDDVYWCAADVGWVTGHSYIVYGPLANATTGVMYEGTPGHARPGIAGGRSSRTTRSRSCTARRPRSGPT